MTSIYHLSSASGNRKRLLFRENRASRGRLFFHFQNFAKFFRDLGRNRLDGDLQFIVGDLNSFHLMWTQQGWKIINAASTLEFVGCEPESKLKN